MKKLVLILMQLVLVFSAAFACRKSKKETKSGPVVLDWQYKDEGSDIPVWVTAIAQSDKKAVIKDLELEDYKVWTVAVSGENLEMLEMFDDIAGATDEISREMATQMNEASIAADTIGEVSVIKVQELLSETEIKGLQKVSSFWIKNGVLKKGVKKAKKESDYQVKFNYYSVWVMDPDLYEVQLERVSKNIGN